MNIRFYCTVWGNTLPFEDFCKRVRSAGYDGVEMDLPEDDVVAREKVRILKDHGLRYIGQYWQSMEADFKQHRENYRRHLEKLAETGPEFINAQTGKDFFSLDQNLELIEESRDLAKSTGVNVVHETHRGKFLFCLPKCVEAIQAVPDIRITLDASHWCNVHESLLADQSDAMRQAMLATTHVHARVGHPEGPQVNDPRAAEWTDALNAHLCWWDAVVAQHRASGMDLTITPEFGPAPYMPEMPHTREPLSSQWDVNVHMMNLLRDRYGV